MAAAAPGRLGAASALGKAAPALQPLTGAEVALAAAAVVAVYGGILGAIHCLAPVPAGLDVEHPGFWGTLPSAWDHPEPNYVVSAGIGEFWSVLTTIPVAGTLLMFEGLKYGYSGKVLCIYALACTMYSLAFVAHLTLQKLVFSTTVVAVMSNALLTFAEFSYIVHRWLESKVVRALVVLAAEVLLIATVAILPYALRAHGGVWTLFTVQSPGVFLATGLAAAMALSARSQEERSTYRIVCAAGSLLSAAMVLSLVECLVGFEYGFLNSLWGFPWLHIVIHVFEQVGIYLFGVGVAALHTLLLQPSSRPGAELRYVGPCLVYLYCPNPPARGGNCAGGSEQALVPGEPLRADSAGADQTAAGQVLEAPGKEALLGLTPVGPSDGKEVTRGRSEAPGTAQEPFIVRQRRVRSPGLVAPRQSGEPGRVSPGEGGKVA